MKKIILILWLLHSTAFADAFEKPRIFVFHINGINVDRGEVYVNLDKLHALSNIRSNVITWDYLYNESHGSLASGLVDVFRQKRQENKNLTIDDYVAVYMKAHGLSYPVGSKEYISLKEQIKELYTKDIGFVGANFDDILGQFKDKLNKLTASFVSLIKSRQYANTMVLLVPHSQGNLYANTLRKYVIDMEKFPKDNIAIYGIANPADKIENTLYPQSNGPVGHPLEDHNIRYMTADNDFVINSLRLFSRFSPATNSPMPANIHLSTCKDFNLCHSLTDAYLADEEAAWEISEQIGTFVRSLAVGLVIKNHDSPQIMYTDFDEAADLIDPSNKILCHRGQCDNDIFGSMFLDAPSFERLQGNQHLIFSFPGKLRTGEYLIVSNAPEDKIGSLILRSNALERADGYTLSPACWYPKQFPDQACYVETYSAIEKYNTSMATFLNVAREHGPFCHTFPNSCYGNRFVFGRFVLSLPKYKLSESITPSLWEPASTIQRSFP